MVDEILIPGQPGTPGCDTQEPQESPNYLIKDNYFSEFETESDKEIARANLGVYGKNEVLTKTESKHQVREAVNNSMRTHLADVDPHQIMPKVESLIGDLVRKDGTTPFTAPQTGVNPVQDFHLTTKKFVTELLSSHANRQDDPHNVMTLVREALQAYVERSCVYLKKDLYTKQEVDRLFSSYITKDGNVPFVRPQIGVTPTLDNHLATKKYVDSSIYSHLVNVDPHGFITILNQRLSRYYSKNETYSKVETYSRAQIDSIVYRLVADAARSALEEHINQSDPHHVLQQIWNKHYVTRDGSVAFTSTQKGVEGIEDDDLIVLSQLNKLKEELQANIQDSQPIWKTSGPVQTTVGFIEDNTPVPTEMSFQEVMDAIFYGKAVEVSSLKVASIGASIPVDMYIRGTGLISQACLYQNGELIGTFYREDFETGHCQVMSKPILEDTEFKFEVEFSNGTSLSTTFNTTVSYGVFVGLLPKWVSGSVVTYDYLKSLVNEDPNNNVMSGEYATDVETITHSFSFTSPDDLKHIILAMPKNYPSLVEMDTLSQHFGIEAFDVVDETPLRVPVDKDTYKDVIFKIYIYREALVAFNSDVTFKLKSHE